MTHCFTRLLRTITASVTVSKVKETTYRLRGLSAAYGDGHVIIAYCQRLRGCTAKRRWHLTLNSHSLLIVCRTQTYCCLSHKYYSQSFYNHFSLCTKTVQKLYQNRPPCCIEVLWAESSCSMYTKIGLY